MDIVYNTINFYDALKAKYGDYLKEEITSIVMVQTEDEVMLETIEVQVVEGGFEKQTVRRENLDFIADGEDDDDLYFNPKDKIEVNVLKFINDFGAYSIINTTDLFREEAWEKISNKYNTFGIDK
ncbi:hypothetical protein [Clostridium sp. DL1XJH146]